MNDQQRSRADRILLLIVGIGGFLAGVVYTLEGGC